MKILDSARKLTLGEISLLEERIGRALPHEYREFLLDHNGGRPEPPNFSMPGARRGTTILGRIGRFFSVDGPAPADDLDHVLAALGTRLPPRLLPIARDPGGSLLCMAIEGSDTGRIYFWDRDPDAADDTPTAETLRPVATSLDELLDKLA